MDEHDDDTELEMSILSTTMPPMGEVRDRCRVGEPGTPVMNRWQNLVAASLPEQQVMRNLSAYRHPRQMP